MQMHKPCHVDVISIFESNINSRSISLNRVISLGRRSRQYDLSFALSIAGVFKTCERFLRALFIFTNLYQKLPRQFTYSVNVSLGVNSRIKVFLAKVAAYKRRLRTLAHISLARIKTCNFFCLIQINNLLFEVDFWKTIRHVPTLTPSYPGQL